MMKAIAKAQIRLFRTHVCFTCWVGLSAEETNKKIRRNKTRFGDDDLKLNVKCVKVSKVFEKIINITGCLKKKGGGGVKLRERSIRNVQLLKSDRSDRVGFLIL